ncbi:hypothetical protein DSECCO2_467550 [anaerobic digester metagenome]
MNQMEIRKYALSQGYIGALPLGKWRGYDAYEPIVNEEGTAFIGPPLMILVKGDEIRMSTVEEAFQQIEEMNDKTT